MNLEHLKKNVWQRVQLLPIAREIDELGRQRPLIDDDWIVQVVLSDRLELFNVRSRHVAKLGADHVHHFTSNPQRSAAQGNGGFLTLNVQIFMQGNRLWVRPNSRPGEAVEEPVGAQPRTDALSRAKAIGDQATFERSKVAFLQSVPGFVAVKDARLSLFTEIEDLCATINASSGPQISTGHDIYNCVLTNGRISIHAGWEQRSPNDLAESGITVTEVNGQAALPGQRVVYPWGAPKSLKQHRFRMEVAPGMSVCWVDPATATSLLISAELADRCVGIYLDLLDRANSGKLPVLNPVFGGARTTRR
jgi:hypothetical protein